MPSLTLQKRPHSCFELSGHLLSFPFYDIQLSDIQTLLLEEQHRSFSALALAVALPYRLCHTIRKELAGRTSHFWLRFFDAEICIENFSSITDNV
jgi:hypothetical protein